MIIKSFGREALPLRSLGSLRLQLQAITCRHISRHLAALKSAITRNGNVLRWTSSESPITMYWSMSGQAADHIVRVSRSLHVVSWCFKGILIAEVKGSSVCHVYCRRPQFQLLAMG